MKKQNNEKKKTNAIRLLEQAGILFSTVEYEVDESDLSGEHVATQLNQPVEQVFKTLVVRGEKNGIMVCCIPVAEELDMKKVATLTNNKKVEMVYVKELLGLTGYIRGGCSPIGMKKGYPTYIDETAILFDHIFISAGIRGMQIAINPEQLCNYIKAQTADLVKN